MDIIMINDRSNNLWNKKSDKCNKKLKSYLAKIAVLEYVFDNNLTNDNKFKKIN